MTLSLHFSHIRNIFVPPSSSCQKLLDNWMISEIFDSFNQSTSLSLVYDWEGANLSQKCIKDGVEAVSGQK